MSRTCETVRSLFSSRNYGLQITHWIKKSMFTHMQNGLTPIFFMPKFFKEILFTRSFMQNNQGVLKLFRKTKEGGVHTLKEKIRKRLIKLWMHLMYLEFSSTLNPCSCSWMFCVPDLVPDIEYFAWINHIIFN